MSKTRKKHSTPTLDIGIGSSRVSRVESSLLMIILAATGTLVTIGLLVLLHILGLAG